MRGRVVRVLVVGSGAQNVGPRVRAVETAVTGRRLRLRDGRGTFGRRRQRGRHGGSTSHGTVDGCSVRDSRCSRCSVADVIIVIALRPHFLSVRSIDYRVPRPTPVVEQYRRGRVPTPTTTGHHPTPARWSAAWLSCRAAQTSWRPPCWRHVHPCTDDTDARCPPRVDRTVRLFCRNQ